MKLDIQKFAVTKSTTFAESNLNVQNNTSTLKISITFSANNSVTYFSSATLKCTCNGVTQSKTVSHPVGGSASASFTFSNIRHNADGTKTVSWSWSCATGTSVLGTISDSGTRRLTNLHKPPVFNVSDITLTELNQNMIDAGVPSGTYVRYMSQVKVQLDNATYYDNAVFKKLELYEATTTANKYNKYLELTTNPATFIPLKSVYNNTLYFTLYDSLNGSKSIVNEGKTFNIINYVNLNINGSVKRVGQTSGQVSISCNGVYYNGDIGNVIQSGTYKPTIMYKFWEAGDTEPSWSDTSVQVNTINASNINVSNGTYEVSNLNIGSTTIGEQQAGSYYFDYQKSYKLKIKVNDNFNEIETSELIITLGIPVWSEYPDHVDFQKITIQGLDIKDYNILWQGTPVYVIDTHTLPLSDLVSNQKNGIVLVWQAYSGGQVQSYDFNYTFIPKFHTAINNGAGVVCWLSNTTGTTLAAKYIYVSDNQIKGNANNGTGRTQRTNSNIYTNNNSWVLTAVLGV